MQPYASFFFRIVAVGALILCSVGVALTQQKLDRNCTVSVLNRTVRVNPDGSWILPNIPANFGQVKARATCVNNGITSSGESAFFSVPANGAVNLPDIFLGSASQVPSSLSLSPPLLSFTAAGQSSQLSVTATYPDNSTRNVTASTTGTTYTSSNQAIASVSSNGAVTAVASGTVVIQATNDGAAAILSASVVLSSTDSDADGIPDDVEVQLGLDPNNPVDAQEDFDRDGLTNLREIQLGTDLRKPDTDADGLSDGDEVNQHLTNPLLADTDSDLIPDGVELQTATNPLDRNSYDLRRATASSVVTPASLALTTSVLFPNASQQLNWKVNLIDGKTTLDLTDDPRTNYSSSDVTVCNFGAQRGLVFAGNAGNCVITISNNTLSVAVAATVRSFTPAALSFVDIPGFANNVDVSGSYAYVAAGSTGLQVVDVSSRLNPRIVTSRSLAGNANDVVVAGNNAYVAAGTAGLQIINISDPLAPSIVGSLNTGGEAWDVVVKGNRAYVANGANGLVIIDVSSPATPTRVGSLSLVGTSKGVDVDTVRQIAAVAMGNNGLAIVNVASPASPTLLATLAGGDVRDVAISGNFVFLADFSRSFTSVDLTNPATPVVRASTPQSLGGLLQDVAVNGSIAAGADVFFVNGVPMIDVSNPASPAPRLILDFRSFRDDNATGIAMDSSFVYLTAQAGGISENGVSGTTRLYIGQYQDIQDNQGVAPAVQITSPSNGSQVIQGSTLTVTANAADDIAVAGVNFFVNGQMAFTATAAPYQYTFTAPVTGSTLVLGATAVDFGGNVGQAPTVTLNLIPDPGTTAVGRIVNTDGTPQSGAVVTCLGVSATSASDGSFAIPGVPTIAGAISCTAVLTLSDGSVLRGTSQAVTPIPAALSDVGDIVIGRLAYLGFNSQDNARLLLTGWRDGTSFTLSALEDGRVLRNGTIDRFGTMTIPLSGVRHFKLEVSTPLLATFGFDCCNFGGSFFYPAVDGTSLVGRSFIFRIPVLSSANEFIIFAYEASNVTVRNTAGQVVLSTNLPAGQFFSTMGAPLGAGTVYQLEATGDVALMSNSRNAYTVVSSRNGGDVGTEFLCGTLNWETSAIAVFAYDDAVVTATRIQNGAQAFTRTLRRGEFAYVPGFGDEKFRITSTGRIAVWAGSTEGGNSIGSMGDNATINTGDRGREFFIHTQSQGGFVLILDNQTRVEIDGVAQTLNAGQFIDLPPQTFRHIVANKPVIVETIGGNGLNDWETALRLIR